VLSPIDHRDPSHVYVTEQGSRISVGRRARQDAQEPRRSSTLTDSIRMFKLGLEGGKPEKGKAGVQPEWFYKGDGSTLAPPGGDLVSPSFALDGGEEPEIVGVYLIDPQGAPVRIGFALGNEFSDHVTERQNYLYLAIPSYARRASGRSYCWRPAADVQGVSRIRRGKAVIWRSRSSRASRTCRTRSPTSRRTISNTRCSAARRRPRPFLRHGDAFVQRRDQTGEGRRVRDRGGGVRLPLRTGCPEPRRRR